MKFANTKFTHFDRTFEPGDEVPDDDEMVRLRPDLFDGDDDGDVGGELAAVVAEAERQASYVAPDQPAKRARVTRSVLDRVATERPELADAIGKHVAALNKPPAKRPASKKAATPNKETS